MARSCLQARGPRAKVLPCVVEERDFRGLCLGNVFGWKLGQEGSLSSDTKYDVPSKEMEKLSLQEPKQSKSKVEESKNRKLGNTSFGSSKREEG